MNDIFKLEQDNKKWHNHSPKRGDAPAPRFGHVQFCFYNYIIIFGGMGD